MPCLASIFENPLRPRSREIAAFTKYPSLVSIARSYVLNVEIVFTPMTLFLDNSNDAIVVINPVCQNSPGLDSHLVEFNLAVSFMKMKPTLLVFSVLLAFVAS